VRLLKSLKFMLVVLVSFIFTSPVFANDRGHDRHYFDPPHKEYRGHHHDKKHCRWVSGYWKHGRWHPAKMECWHR